MKPCLEKNRTLAYALGKISPDLVDSVASHVDSCSDCQTTLASAAMADDTLVTNLRIAATKEPIFDEPELKRAANSARAAIVSDLTQQFNQSGERTVHQPESPTMPPEPPNAHREAAAEQPEKQQATEKAGIVGGPSAPAGTVAMPPSVEQFSKALQSTGLMTADELAAFQAEHLPGQPPPDVQKLAQALVEQGKLTRFQAAHLLQNKAKGLVFGEYLVIDKIGAGGMGQVFKARHRRMKRLVAIKVLPPAAVKTPDAVKRFQREVEAAAKLVHPNIVIAHDAGESQGLHFLVMEFVEGQDLSSLVKENGPLPVETAVSYVSQAGAGWRLRIRKA